MTSSRNKNQEVALQIIYTFLLSELSNTQINFEEVLSLTTETPFDEIDSFLRLVSLKVLKYQTEIEETYIIPNLTHWTIDRLPLLTRAILLLAYAHFYYIKNVEKAVVINIAIQQAKSYLDKNEHRFINAILDKTLN